MKAFDQTGQKVGIQINVDESSIKLHPTTPVGNLYKKVKAYLLEHKEIKSDKVITKLFGGNSDMACYVMDKLVEDGIAINVTSHDGIVLRKDYK